MKYLFTLFVSFLFSHFILAQSSMQNTVEYNGQKYPCYVIEYNLPPDETEDVIKNKLKAQGYSADKSKGFLVYRNVRLNGLDPDGAMDVLFKVDRKSRQERDKSMVTLITAKPGEIPEDKVKGAKIVANISSSDNSASFLNSFREDVVMKAYQMAVSAQTEVVAKAEKNLQKLKKEQSHLEKKIKQYQDELAVNKKDQEKQVKDLAKQRAILQKKIEDKPVGN